MIKDGLRDPVRLTRPTQTTLLSFSLLLSCISGVLVGVGLMQGHPPECTPNRGTRDDGFYALLSQVLLQWLSLYCTLIPLARDKAAVLRGGSSGLALGGSAVASIVAPATYGASWQASMVANFISGFMALMASVQLAGGMQRHQRGLDLGD